MTTFDSEWLNDNDIELPEDFLRHVPDPTTWRLVVLPKAPLKTSAGGIILTAANQEEQAYKTHVGQVVKLGPLVGKRPPISDAPFDIGVGDWVVFGKYAGQRIEVKGVKLQFLNDEDILAKTADPDSLKAVV